MDIVPKGYQGGTHRLISPEKTLEIINPHLLSMGITRCADVTNLDRIGIPVTCSIRPRGKLLQVSNGKGLHYIEAKVSSLMEGIEMFHAENPVVKFRCASLTQMVQDGNSVIDPRQVPTFCNDSYFTNDFVTNWTKGDELLSKKEVWLPASAIYWPPPSLFNWNSNGLASGNNLMEAILHGIYEIIERDSLSQIHNRQDRKINFGLCDVIELDTITNEAVCCLIERIRKAGLKLLLFSPQLTRPIHTFYAVLLDPEPLGNASIVNVGSGAHLSPTVAAIRAITEAAQSRLTFIHASREDLTRAAYQNTHKKLYDKFLSFQPDTDWSNFIDNASDTLSEDYQIVLQYLTKSDFPAVYRVDMSRSEFGVAVVKIFIVNSRMDFPV